MRKYKKIDATNYMVLEGGFEKMDEFEFIEKIKQDAYKQPSLIKGVGDDAAIIQSFGYDVVTAVDTFVDGIHFTAKTASPFQIGYKSLSANISDMAAMGAEPKFYLVSMVVPPSIDETTLLRIYEGFHDIACKHKMDLIGGDTVSGNELVISITVIGHVSPNKARLRSDARVKDIVFVTGTLGDAAAGLHILLHNEDAKDKKYFIHRHQMPEPRMDLAMNLHHLERVCLNDVTDGIANELREIAEASDVSIQIEDKAIPVYKTFNQFSSDLQEQWKYFGGEDFELVGTIAPKDWSELQYIAEKLGVRLTKIGNVIAKPGEESQVFLRKNSTTSIIEKNGYIHLK